MKKMKTREQAEDWLDKYLSKKLRKSSSEYETALKSYRFVFNKAFEFALGSQHKDLSKTCGYCVKEKQGGEEYP